MSTSGSRTAVAEQAGAKTQLTGVVGAVAIVLMLVLVPGLLRNLPQPTLAAVVIAASLSLADIPATRAALAPAPRRVPALGRGASSASRCSACSQGIAIAVALSILNVFRRAWWPYQTTLGRVPGLPGQHDRSCYPDAEQLPGLVDLPLRRAAVLRQRADVPRRRSARSRRPTRARAGSSSPPSRSRTSTRPPPTCSATSTRSSTRPAPRSCSPSSRTRCAPSSSATSSSGRWTRPTSSATLDAAVEAYRSEFGADWRPAAPSGVTVPDAPGSAPPAAP